MIFYKNDIEKLIPHRSPFLFLDECEIIIPGEHGISKKTFKEDEYFFEGHFRPIGRNKSRVVTRFVSVFYVALGSLSHSVLEILFGENCLLVGLAQSVEDGIS